MILLHLFHSALPRVLDTPHMRLFLRASCVALLALVLAGAVSRGEEPAAAPSADQPAAPSPGRGNVSIVHVESAPETGPAAASDVNAPVADASSESTPAGSPAGHATEVAEQAATPVGETPASVESAHADGPATPHDGSAAVPSHGESAASELTQAEAAHSPTKPEAAHEPTVPATAHANVPATSAAAHTPAPAPSHGAPATHGSPTGRPEVVDDFAESGRRFWQAGDHASAEKAFTRALTANVPVEKKRSLVLEMAGLYRSANQLTKSASVLEKFVKTFPNDREVPQVLLQLGATYRDLGVYSMATARFFQVLNSTLRVSDEDIPEYRKLAMKARLEIAETYAMQGNLAEAEKYFARLQLLELDPIDRERVLLRGAQMQYTLKQWLGAEKALANFAAASPESPNLAEVRYMRAKSLDELGRKQEAVDEVVALLQMPLSGDPEVARNTAYWKRRCANEIANRFYEQGDFLGALAVYQALARASMDPTWRWPAIYQIGLCFERMDMPQRAAEAYDAILTPETAPAPGVKLPESLVSLQDMARWRRSHLVWIGDKGRQLESLAGEKPAS